MLPPLEVVLHGPSILADFVPVLFMVEFVDQPDHFCGVGVVVLAFYEPSLDVLQASDSRDVRIVVPSIFL